MSPDVCAKGLDERLSGLFVDRQNLCGGCCDERRIFDRSQVDEPYAVRELVQYIGRNLQRQASFAEATHAQQREQARPLEQALSVGELALAPDERRDLLWQVVRRGLE